MKKNKAIITLVIITLLYCVPFFSSGMFKTDDGIWAVVRLASIHNELRQGQIPVRWSGNLNFGYGYPLFNFSYPAPYYIGQIFNFIGGSYEWSIKSMFVLATMMSVLGMYLCTKQLFGNTFVAVVSAILYCIHPYRWINIYVRGSLGEIVASAAMPFIIYAGLKILNNPQKKYIVTGASALALLITSHNIMALLFLPLFFAMLITETAIKYPKSIHFANIWQKKHIKNEQETKQSNERKIILKHLYALGLMIGVGIALSAFFWLPAIYEIKYTKLAITPLTDITAEFQKIKYGISSPFDNRAKTDSTIENYYNILTMIFFIAVCIATLFSYKERKKTNHVLHQRILIYTAIYLCMLLCMTQGAGWVWKYMPMFNKIDFPWRLHGIGMLIQPLIIATIALRKKLQYPIGAFLALIIITTLIYPKLPERQNLPNTYYATNQATTTSATEYLNRWIKKAPQTPPVALITEQEGEKILSYTVNKNTSTLKSLTYIVEKATPVEINIMYFPGWLIKLNGHDHAFTYENGYIQTNLPQGSHTLEIRFTNTPVREIANIISLTTGIACAIIAMNAHRKKEKGAQ